MRDAFVRTNRCAIAMMSVCLSVCLSEHDGTQVALQFLNYEERLRKLNLPTLKFRRIRGDMIEVYKIFNGKYDEEVTRWLRSRHYESHYDLRGHQFNIYQS